MPPKRKAANTKAAKDAKAEDVAAENGAAGDAPKTKRGKAAKEEAAEEIPKSKRGRPVKVPEKEVEDEDDEELEEEEAPKETKTRGRKTKAAAAEEKEPDARPKRGRAGKEKQPEEEKAKTKAKKGEPKKKAARAKRGKAAESDHESDADGSEEDIKSKNVAKTKAGTSEAAPAALKNDTVTDYSKIDFSCTRKNMHGQSFNYKISSWNVDGIRAWSKKDGYLYITKEDADIVCLQETKCSTEKLPAELKKVDPYKAYWCSSEKDGYAGVALLTKTEPVSIKYGIGLAEHDDEGRCITAEYEKFFLVNVYVPNAGRKLVTLPKRLSWNAAFKAFIKDLDQQKPVIVCGDMNVSHKEIDLANPKTNKKNAGFTQEERDGMSDFLDNGYVDTYRELYPDVTGVYTFWTYMMKARSKNVGWRLDYFIVSKRIMDTVCDNVVRSEVLGSDHCPITLLLNI